MPRDTTQHGQRVEPGSSLNQDRLSACSKWNQLELGADATRVRRTGRWSKERLYARQQDAAVQTRQGCILASVPSASAKTSSLPVIH